MGVRLIYQCVLSTGNYGEQVADGSITLVKSKNHIVLVDTGGLWDREFLLKALSEHKLEPKDITEVVGTHGHSDHIGNLNLFPQATFIVSYDICNGHVYIDNDLAKGEPYLIDIDLAVVPTPGHTGSDVSLVVENSQLGTVVVAGDLFESEADLQDPSLWQGSSENPEIQERNRAKILQIADYIVPGHGKIFKVTDEMKNLEKIE